MVHELNLIKFKKFNNIAYGAFYGRIYLSCRKVKGKQVKILYDLVTVIEERYTFAKVYLSKVTEKSGRLYIASMHKSGNLPFLLVQNLKAMCVVAGRFRSRGIDRTVFRLPAGGLFAMPSDFTEAFFIAHTIHTLYGRIELN